MIPEPRPGDYRFGPDGQLLHEAGCAGRLAGRLPTAEAARRALAEDIIKMLLPARACWPKPGAEDAIGEAVRRAPGRRLTASPWDVILQLRGLAEWGLENRGPLLASRLEALAEHPLARLFFPRPDADPAELSHWARRLLTVMTLRGLVCPRRGSAPGGLQRRGAAVGPGAAPGRAAAAPHAVRPAPPVPQGGGPR